MQAKCLEFLDKMSIKNLQDKFKLIGYGCKLFIRFTKFMFYDFPLGWVRAPKLDCQNFLFL